MWLSIGRWVDKVLKTQAAVKRMNKAYIITKDRCLTYNFESTGRRMRGLIKLNFCKLKTQKTILHVVLWYACIKVGLVGGKVERGQDGRWRQISKVK